MIDPAYEEGFDEKVADINQTYKQAPEKAIHGTLFFTCNFNVAPGKLATCTVNKTRNEKDFAEHIRSRVNSDPLAIKWDFIYDNLTTHMSA